MSPPPPPAHTPNSSPRRQQIRRLCQQAPILTATGSSQNRSPPDPSMDSDISSCFGGGAAPSSSFVPTSTTVYDTHLGLAAFTWSRTLLGLSLRVDLRLPSSSSPLDHLSSASSTASTSTVDPQSFTTLSFNLRPILLWKRKGHSRFRIHDPLRTVDFSWDLSRAAFSDNGSPEPTSRFSVTVSVDGDLLLDTGSDPVVLSRTEHVVLSGGSVGGRSYETSVKVGARETEVGFELPGAERDARMGVTVGGNRVLNVKRLRWKFRGSEKTEGVQVSWDVHGWLFPGRADAPPESVEAPPSARPELGHGVVVVRFDGEVGCSSKVGLWGLPGAVGGGGKGKKGWWRRRSGLLKPRRSLSSSSASSASSGAGSSVMDWASCEENELRETEGLTLVVHMWRR